MEKGRIFYLEDEKEWIERVRELLADEYDFYAASSLKEAVQLFNEMAADDLKIDLALIDVSLIKDDAHDKKGLKFVEALEKSGIMLGHSIIILSAYTQTDENWRVAFRDYQVVDVYDKGNYADERLELKQTIKETIEKLRG